MNPRLAIIACLECAFAVAAALPLRAQDTSESRYFRDKIVHLVVGYGAGGGFDAYARMIAPYFARALGTNVIVENMPGAGGISALNRTAAAPPDGLTLQIVNGTGAALSQLLELQAVRYDLLQLSHLGTVTVSPWMWMVGPASTIRTPADAVDSTMKISWAASGPIDGLADGAAFTCEALKLNCRVVIGYKGTNDAAIAVVRGEMDAIYVSDSTAATIAKTGNVRAIATMGRNRSRYFPATPSIFDTVNVDPDSTWILEFRSSAEDLGRIVVAPPGVQQARLAYLRNALRIALSDRNLVAEGDRTQRSIAYFDAGVTTANVRKVLEAPTSAQKARVKAIISKAE